MAAFTINGAATTVDTDPDTPLLWVIRENLKLTGTRYGRGIAACGTCTVHVNGRAVRSCITPVSAVESASITTIEGLSPDGSHPLQRAWVAEQVPQCGYCQSGQIMQAAVPEQLPDIDPERDLKRPEDFRLLGTDVPRVDVPSKVDGSVRYAMDIWAA